MKRDGRVGVVPHIGTHTRITKYGVGEMNDVLDRTNLITDTGHEQDLCIPIRVCEAPSSLPTGLWFNRDIVGPPARLAGRLACRK
jgi:hypothetical protein